ncbi:MAG: cytochrome oxidase I, partial [bacterium]|nr:cytochrome oxidase I [bacterium]
MKTNLAELVERLRSERVPHVFATVVRAERPTSAKPGDAALVLEDGTIEGFVGGACAESTVRAQSLQTLVSGEPTLLRISPEPVPRGSEEHRTPGLVSVSNPCLSGGTLDIFLEPSLPPPLVLVYGDAPIAQALLRAGGEFGFETRPAPAGSAIPDGTAAVVVATHGRDEEAILQAARQAGVPYVGLVASHRRGAAVLE